MIDEQRHSQGSPKADTIDDSFLDDEDLLPPDWVKMLKAKIAVYNEHQKGRKCFAWQRQ